MMQQYTVALLDYNGNVPAAKELFHKQLSVVRKHNQRMGFRDAGSELGGFLRFSFPSFVDVTFNLIHSEARAELLKLLVELGCTDAQSCDEFVNGPWNTVMWQSLRYSSADGQHHVFHIEGQRALLWALLSMSQPTASSIESSWVDRLPPPSDSRRLHDIVASSLRRCNPRTLIGEVLERLGQLDAAIAWAQVILSSSRM